MKKEKKTTQSRVNLVKSLLEAVDSNNPDLYISFFTDDAVYKIANAEPVIGPQGILGFLKNFPATIKSVAHDTKNFWEIGDTVICEVDIIYTRQDEKVFRIPNINIVRFKGDKIQQYQAFLDVSPVFS